MGNVTWQNYFLKQEAQKLYRKPCYVTVTGDKRFYHVLYFSTLFKCLLFFAPTFLASVDHRKTRCRQYLDSSLMLVESEERG